MVKRSFLSFFAAVFLFLFLPFGAALAKEVILGGQNIGIELKTPGLVISGTYDVGNYNPATNADVKRGDIIVKANGINISNVDDFIEVLSKIGSDSVEVEVEIVRNEKTLTRNLKIIRENEASPWKTGLFVKERVLGTGTITYYDPTNNTYGALGHQMSSSDNILSLGVGNIYKSSVTGIKKSVNGTPGQKISSIDESVKIGTIAKNNDFGIYGVYKDRIDGLKIETASVSEVKLGKAYFYTVIADNKVEKFEIEIIKARSQNSSETKGITFKVTDKRLLSKTGGIVSGMSGSPIIQNGKLIGAVTHVIVDKVEYGHGIYIDWMLEQSDNLSKSTPLAFFKHYVKISQRGIYNAC